MVDLIIRNGIVVTMDKQRRIINDGAIVIDADRILDIGKTEELKNRYKAETEFDAKGKVVIPGLINAHGHLWEILFRGIGDDRPLLDWAFNALVPLMKHITESDCYAAAMLACVEMIRSGTTCCVDNTFAKPVDYTDFSARAIESTGMRGILAPGVVDMEYPEWMRVSVDRTVNDSTKLIKEWHGKADGRIKIWLGPITPGVNASTELLKEIRRLADTYKVGITVHLAEVPERVEFIKRKYGFKGHVEYAYSIGLLGHDVLGAHCIWLSDKDIHILRLTNTKVVHNPGSNMYLADGIAPVPRLLKSGITVALGTDSAFSNNNLDMIEEIRLAALLHKVNELDPTVITAQKVLEMATIDGAKALGLEHEIGSLEIGKKADIVLLSLKKPHMIPAHRVISNIVYCANGNDVETVIIDGKIVMENREIKTVKEEEVIKKAEKAAIDVVDRSGVRVPSP